MARHSPDIDLDADIAVALIALAELHGNLVAAHDCAQAEDYTASIAPGR
ncbi:hypothetical protein [Actinomadura kijaniata]|nr:hypothetical protein [Actinomadura kijaniata]